MRIRQVVTGHSPEGKSVVASDCEVEGMQLRMMPGSEAHRLWGADQTPEFPDDGSPRPAFAWFPPVGGFRFVRLSFPPQGTPPPKGMDPQALLRDAEEKAPGMLSTLDHRQPGMHTSDTIDLEYVLSGEIDLELDDGVEVHLRPGDTLVQNGTRHAWHNRGAEPCVMVACLIGPHRSLGLKPQG